MKKRIRLLHDYRRKVRRRKLIVNVVSNDEKKDLLERGELNVILPTEAPEHV